MRQRVDRAARGVPDAWFDSLLEGFGLVQNRLRRVLVAESIARIECVDRPVDPERMMVVELADQPDRPPQTVVDELRRGYTWKGRLLRLAEVRATPGRLQGDRVEAREDDCYPEAPASLEDASRGEWHSVRLARRRVRRL